MARLAYSLSATAAPEPACKRRAPKAWSWPLALDQLATGLGDRHSEALRPNRLREMDSGKACQPRAQTARSTFASMSIHGARRRDYGHFVLNGGSLHGHRSAPSHDRCASLLSCTWGGHPCERYGQQRPATYICPANMLPMPARWRNFTQGRLAPPGTAAALGVVATKWRSSDRAGSHVQHQSVKTNWGQLPSRRPFARRSSRPACLAASQYSAATPCPAR